MVVSVRVVRREPAPRTIPATDKEQRVGLMERWIAPSKTRLPLQRLLQGNWRLARRITSLHDGAELGAVILGTASFLPVAEAPLDLLYREAGQVQLPGKATALRFERSYLYTFESERSATVRFYESKPSGGEHLKLFHSLAFGDDGRARASHRCVEDLYEVEFDFCSESELASRWVVRGPEKAYEVASTLSRDGPTRPVGGEPEHLAELQRRVAGTTE